MAILLNCFKSLLQTVSLPFFPPILLSLSLSYIPHLLEVRRDKVPSCMFVSVSALPLPVRSGDFTDFPANCQLEIFEKHKTLRTINFILMGPEKCWKFRYLLCVCREHFIKHLFAWFLASFPRVAPSFARPPSGEIYCLCATYPGHNEAIKRVK